MFGGGRFVRSLMNGNPVSINHESIENLHDQCFRVLRWYQDVNAVEVYDTQRGCFVGLQGVGSQWHRHPEIEITLVTSGSGIRVIGDESITIPNSESLVVLGRGLPHYWKFNGKSSGVSVQFSDIRLLGLLPEQSRVEAKEFIDRASFGLEFANSDRDIAMAVLQQLSGDTVGESHLENFGLFLQLIGKLARVPVDATRRISSMSFDGSFNEDNYFEMQIAVDWIMSNYQSEIRLVDVLELIKMSKTSFSRHFGKFTGLSFSKFVNETRISNACLLLHSTEYSISEIALDSGFSNLSNFNRLFRQSKGMAPSQYRAGPVSSSKR